MELADVSAYFMQDQVYDAYSSAPIFLATTSFLDEKGSNAAGPAARHFAMSVPFGTSMPSRRAVTIVNDSWIVGANNPDGYRGAPISDDYEIRKSSGLMTVLMPGQACLSGSGTTMHGHKEYLRDNSNTLTDSGLNVFWNISCALGEALTPNKFMRDAGSRLFRIRNVYTTVEGFQVCEVDDIGSPGLQAIQFTSNGAYVPATDSFTSSVVNTYGIEIDVPNAFSYRTAAESDYRAGDKTLYVPASQIVPKVGAVLLMGGLNYAVKTSVPDQDAYLLRVRLT